MVPIIGTNQKSNSMINNNFFINKTKNAPKNAPINEGCKLSL